MSNLSKSNIEALKSTETPLEIGLKPTPPVKRSKRLQDQSSTKETAALKLPLSDKKKKNKVKIPKKATAPLSDRNDKNNVEELPTLDSDEELILPNNFFEIIKTEIIEDEDQDQYQDDESVVFLAEKKSRTLSVVKKPNNAKDLDIIKNSTKPKSSRGAYDRKALNCSKCDKIFYKKENLDKHKRDVHERKQSNVYELSKEQEVYKCTFEGCEEEFKTKRSRTLHIKFMHSDSGDVNEQKPNLICHHCLKTLSSGKALQVHLKRHLQIKEFICKKCGAAKVTATELVTHMRSHEDIGTFKCPLCPNLLKHKYAVARHLRLVHKCTFKCPLCPKLMKHQNAIDRHVRLKHNSVANE